MRNFADRCTPFESRVFSSDTNVLFHFIKTDPTKDSWGDLSLEVTSKL